MKKVFYTALVLVCSSMDATATSAIITGTGPEAKPSGCTVSASDASSVGAAGAGDASGE